MIFIGRNFKGRQRDNCMIENLFPTLSEARKTIEKIELPLQ